jgi:hypothetical protein
MWVQPFARLNNKVALGKSNYFFLWVAILRYLRDARGTPISDFSTERNIGYAELRFAPVPAGWQKPLPSLGAV